LESYGDARITSLWGVLQHRITQATLVPTLSDSMKYCVVAGALAGGGLTVIANAPNPAGQAILARFFQNGIAPLGAVPATVIMILCFLCAR
jgi:hypothetical protein